MRRDPRVRLLCYDPREPLRYLEVLGTVIEMTEAGAAEHLNDLASKYAGPPALAQSAAFTIARGGVRVG